MRWIILVCCLTAAVAFDVEAKTGCVWHRIVEMILNPRRHPLNTENPTFDSFERCAI
jgi:hypothetical protein